MNIRAIIFDVYGTLLEVGPATADADARWHRLCRTHLDSDPPLSRLEFSVATSRIIARHHATARARGIGWPEIHWPAVVAEVLPALSRLQGNDREDFLFRQIQTGHTTRMSHEVAAVLRRLKEHSLLLGIASNAQAYTLRELREALAGCGLGMSLFEADLCFWSFDHGFSKPDPHVFQILAARLRARGIGDAEVLMVGDRMDNDIRPARAWGWQAWQLGAHADGGWAALLDRLCLLPAKVPP